MVWKSLMIETLYLKMIYWIIIFIILFFYDLCLNEFRLYLNVFNVVFEWFKSDFPI